MLVSEILAIKGKVLFTVSSNRALSEAVAIMTEQDVGSLVVFDKGRMVGLLTFREVLKAVHRHKGNLASVKVEDVMLSAPITASPDMETNELRHLLIENHQRYVPVMDGTTLMGVLSFLDVAKSVLEEQNFENKMLKNYIKNWPEGDGGAAA